MRHVRLLLFLLLLLPVQVWAASAQYVNPGSSVSFQDSAGTAVLVFASKATGNGHISGQVDLGDPHSPWYTLTCTFRTSGATVTGSGFRMEYYLAWAAVSTHPDAEKGTAAAAITAATDVLNMKPALVILVDKTTSNSADTTGSALVNIPTQYVQVAYMNQTNVTLSATGNQSTCSLQAAPLEQQ